MHAAGRQSGFTLIEASIVLAVIGLLVGGIFVGTHMYYQAGLVKIITERDIFTSGMENFEMRFNAVPGDMTNATDYWGTDPECPNGMGILSGTMDIKEETCNGDGNKRVDGAWIASEMYQETLRFWQHLANAGLIPGKYAGGIKGFYNGGCGAIGISIPATQASQAKGAGWELVPVYRSTQPGIYGGNIPGMDPVGYYQDKYYGLLLRMATCTRSPGDSLCGAAISPADAFQLDQKVDDGKPWGGTMTAVTGIDNAVGTCVTHDAPELSEYRRGTGRACIIYFEMNSTM